MSVILGIDPGATGWIVAVDSDGFAWSLPLPDSPMTLASSLREHPGLQVFVERQHAVHGQGLSSTFTTAQGFGRIEGVVAALGMPLRLVRSQDWQKVMLRGEPKASGKELKRLYTQVAERLWPSVPFRGPRGGLLDGKAAAALIAEYGRRVIVGGGA
jgi:hypothetical protein